MRSRAALLLALGIVFVASNDYDDQLPTLSKELRDQFVKAGVHAEALSTIFEDRLDNCARFQIDLMDISGGAVRQFSFMQLFR